MKQRQQGQQRPRSRGELTEVYDLEHAARIKFIESQRRVLKSASSTSRLLLAVTRRTEALALRAVSDEYSGKDLKEKLAEVPPAEDAAVVELATKLNTAMAHLYPQDKTQASYFKLFRHMDKDQSGLISLYEFEKMVREVLKIPVSKMPETEVQGMWRWVDADASGQISSGEFLKLMRGGWAGFLSERDELRKRDPKSIFLRKNWEFATVRHPTSAWPIQTMSLAERRQFYVDAARGEALERTSKLHAKANAMEERALAIQAKLEAQRKLLGAAGVSTSRRAGVTTPSTTSNTAAASGGGGGGGGGATRQPVKNNMGASASAPVLGGK